MKRKNKKKVNKYCNCKILSIIGIICFSIPLLFLDNLLLSGIFCVFGFFLLILGGKLAIKKSDYIINYLALLIGHIIRYISLFDYNLFITSICSLMFIPYCIIIFASIMYDKKLCREGKYYVGVFIVPIVYTVLTYLLSLFNLGYVVNIPSYVMFIPPFVYNLSWLGEYIMTFIIMLFISGIANVIVEKKLKNKLVVGFGLIVLLIILFMGMFIRDKKEEPDYEIRVALATSQECDFIGKKCLEHTNEFELDMFSNALDKALDEKAELLVLNEEYFSWKYEDVDYMLSSISNIIKEKGIPVLAGIEITNKGKLDINEAIYFDKDGEIKYTYLKSSLVPFIEGGYYEEGNGIPANLDVVIGEHEINLSYIICFDLNDGTYMNKIPDSTELLIVPAWEWDSANMEQLRLSTRSAMLNTTLIKHAFDGFGVVSNPNGKVLERVDTRDAYENVYVVDVPIWEK